MIQDGNGWTEIQRDRNLTSHTDDEHLADEVYAFIASRALDLLRALAEEAGQWRATN
ncbi:nucleotidyltransferase substrate binding protein [Thioflavicoccus mobilis]|uniref:nucleotidyltransferase substrate binding protein n=1 Tax=Thioflavicoccus mobilis TaxID=80679 RepID=UPI0009FF89B0